MVWFYIFGTFLIGFFILRNIISLQNYRKYQKDAIRVFDDFRGTHRVFRIVFLCLLVVMALLFAATIALGAADFNTVMIEICLVGVCCLYAFVPYSQARWVVTGEGVFVYNYNTFVKWSEMESARPVSSRKKSYLVIHILGDEQNKLKQKTYPLLLPGTEVQEMQNMFREFISLEDKRRMKLRIEAERASREAFKAERKEKNQ